MEKTIKTQAQADPPAIVAESVKRFLRRRGTIKEAAATLGVSPTTLSTQLSDASGSYLSQRIAGRLSSAFGLNAEYLTTGVGTLTPDAETPRPLYPLYTETQKNAGSVEERIVLGIRAHLQKLDELGRTYNGLVERITELAECIQGGPYLDYCQKVIKALKNNKVELDPHINPLYEDLFNVAGKL